MVFVGTERFELRRQLGQGGMGVVYQAHDRLRGMIVALKTLRLLDADGLLRFKREFRALSSLSHPNIIQLYELVSEGPDWFFTMEFIDGQDLVSYVRGQEPAPSLPDEGAGTIEMINGTDATVALAPEPIVPALGQEPSLTVAGVLPAQVGTLLFHNVAPTMSVSDMLPGLPGQTTGPSPDSAAGMPRRELDELVDRQRLRDVLGQLASALHALHEAGMVHCDIKPSNVMVTRQGRVVLMDFGLVAATHWSHGLSRLGQIAGTPAFMAPEQIRGEPPSTATDWYAFGVTLYLLLAGRLPFGSSLAQLLLDKQDFDPLLPSTFTQGIPPELETLCMQLLSRDPVRRPHGGDVLASLGQRQRAVTSDRRLSTVPGEAEVFVGRASELAMLRERYQAVSAGHMRWVLVEGPSGMGKTYLLMRFLEAIRAEAATALILKGRCGERESLAYKALDGIIDQISVYLQHVSVEQRRLLLPEGAGLLARLFPVLRRVDELSTSTSITGGMELRLQAVHALRALLAALARERPVVAYIDDLQWADEDSFELLRGLLEPPALPGLLVLATMRSEALRAGENPALARFLAAIEADPAGQRIMLAPLSGAEQHELVARLSAGRDRGTVLDEALVRIAHESAGHPMLLAELARHAEDEEDEPLTEPGTLSLEGVFWRRVARMPEPVRALVEAAAIAGEPTPLGLLAQAAALAPTEQERAQALACAERLTRVTRTGPEPWLDIYHDKVREAVLVNLAAERTRALHEALARILESWGQAPAAALARHWLAVGDRDRAAAYFLRAAHGAAEQLAFERAAGLYRTVAELLEGLPGDSVRDRVRCQALIGQAQGMRLADRNAEALALIDAAETLAGVYHWPEELADIHSLRGNLLFARHDLDGCLAQHERARAYARQIDSPMREASALSGLGDAYYMRGRLAHAYRHYARCVELCRRHGFVDIEAANLSMRGLMQFHYNDLESTLRDATAAAALAARIGHPRAELVAVCGCLARVWREHGWLHGVQPQIERARALAHNLGSRRLEASALALLARLLNIRGRVDEARELIAEGRALVHGLAPNFMHVDLLGTSALLARTRDEREQALAEGQAVVASGTLITVSMAYYRDVMDIALGDGDYERVEHCARAIEHLTAADPLPWARFVVERARSLAAFRQGRRDTETVEALQRLFREAREMGFFVAAEELGLAMAAAASEGALRPR